MNYYLVSWCNTGFESVIDITKYSPEKIGKSNFVKSLSGEKIGYEEIELNRMITSLTLRARLNPQRNYEVYAFMSTVDFETIEEVSQQEPQVLVNCIRESGVCLFNGRAETENNVII